MPNPRSKKKQPTIVKRKQKERQWSAKFLNGSVDAMSIPEGQTVPLDLENFFVTRKTNYNIDVDGTLTFRIRIEGRGDSRVDTEPLFWVACSNVFLLAIEENGKYVGTNQDVPVVLVAQLLMHAQMTIRGLLRAIPNPLLANMVLPPVEFRQTVPEGWKTIDALNLLLDLHI